ncbi:hypothetical protein C2845_PM16G11850 [Panicum miliaceum]|uniref:Uncharacterized protein n=1 Tax=Panicum miliaceum TaxID=4540 RepID=A0A3L6PT67_PANMI|nr:hypothetical protein C2845_PM16G11850 [Panicum miliaceum]
MPLARPLRRSPSARLSQASLSPSQPSRRSLPAQLQLASMRPPRRSLPACPAAPRLAGRHRGSTGHATAARSAQAATGAPVGGRRPGRAQAAGPRMRPRTWSRTCGGRAPRSPGAGPPERMAGIGAAPPATSGSPLPDLPICTIRASSFPASPPGHQSQEPPPASGEEKEMTRARGVRRQEREAERRRLETQREGKGGSLARGGGAEPACQAVRGMGGCASGAKR